MKKIGCDTAKSVLSLSIEELVKRTDLEEETIREVLKVLEDEFDINLDDFREKIGENIIGELKKAELKTAKSVLALSVDELVKRTGIEEEAIRKTLRILETGLE